MFLKILCELSILHCILPHKFCISHAIEDLQVKATQAGVRANERLKMAAVDIGATIYWIDTWKTVGAERVGMKDNINDCT